MGNELEKERIRDTLAGVQPADLKERADLERMRALLGSLAAPLSRAQAEAHFTASALVVDPAGERVCLVHHAKLKRWLQPGGHCEPSDAGDLAAAALREAREETGLTVSHSLTAPRPLDVDIHRIPARKDEPAHDHLDVRYLLVAENPDALAHDPNESFGAQWVTWDEALARADEEPLKRLLRKGRAPGGL